MKVYVVIDTFTGYDQEHVEDSQIVAVTTSMDKATEVIDKLLEDQPYMYMPGDFMVVERELI